MTDDYTYVGHFTLRNKQNQLLIIKNNLIIIMNVKVISNLLLSIWQTIKSKNKNDTNQLQSVNENILFLQI